MPETSRNLMLIAAIALLVTALTQVLYVGLGASGTPLALNLWRTECIAFLVVALAGAAIIAGRPLLGAALGVGGLVNLFQAGMGLAMFGPLKAASDTLGPALQAVLSMAFFLYFSGKVAFGLAGIVLGTQQWRIAKGATRIVGGMAAVTGLAALALNAAAMVSGMSLTFIAGAAGTVAVAFLGLALIMARPPEVS